MKIQRAREIYEAKDTIPVQLDGEQSVWIEKVDVENGMATVRVGTNPLNNQTVAADRLSEPQE